MKYKLKLDLEWEIEAVDEDEAIETLASRIEMNNETVGNIFWEGIEITKVEEK